ncbi:MAG: XamI family restriction endonuclease [Candidatus Binatia bacterium]
MAVNLDKPHLWKEDIAKSVDMYNDWFLKFAPKAFRETRIQTTKDVEATLKATNNLRNVAPLILRIHPVTLGEGSQINIPIDAVIMPKTAKAGELPIIFESNSAGDFTNVNKRRKEEAMKMAQLRHTYRDTVRFNLFLCGYFDSGYLGYEAAEGIDWVWEHRINDLAKFGL